MLANIHAHALRAGLCFALAIAAASCVLSPLHNDIIPGKSSPVLISGYTQVASDTIRVQCRQYLYGTSWTPVTTITSSSVATTSPKGNLYYFSANVVIPDGCWFHWHTQYTTELTFRAGPYLGGSGTSPYAVYDAAGLTCLSTKYATAGSTYSSMMDDCRLKTSTGTVAESMYLHARE